MAKKNRKQQIRKEMKKKQVKESMQEPIEQPVNLSTPEELPEIEMFEDIDKFETDQIIQFQTEAKPRKESFIKKIKFAFSNESKQLKELEALADNVLAKEPYYKNFRDEDFPLETAQLKKRIEDGETLEDILVEAYALVREAALRVLELHAYKVQIMGAITLHHGDISEMKTGEGKTLTSIMPAYLNALEGKGVHIITVNDYLAGRDALNNGKVFTFLGLTVGLNKRELSTTEKRNQHNCDITYTTNSELGFDYLRDNMVKSIDLKVLRPLNFGIVDEVDSILIDESRTPLIISGGERNTAALYIAADQFVKRLNNEEEYEIDITSKSISLTEDGIARAEKHFKVANLFDLENTALVHHINQALKANYIMHKDVEYVVASEDGKIENAEILIVDSFTGRLMPGRAYSDGLHQAIEAKEGVRIKQETVTLATITYQNFFRLFSKLAGMTGTAKTEEEEFKTIYNMRVIEIPTNRPVIREDAPDYIFANAKAKFNALCDEVVRRHSYGQPILIGTIAVETSEMLSKMLKSRGVRHNVLNAKNHSREADIISRAGVKGAVTIATNMAGRGTDIKLGAGVAEIGGLAVIGSERHESRRIDNQLRGRSGRQGDPGYSRFYVSFEDELMQRFGSEKYQGMVGILGNDPLESKAISKSIEGAQRRVEGQNFDSRKQVLQFDDVMRQQREIMYTERDRIMMQSDLGEIMKGMFQQAIEQIVRANTDENGIVDTMNVVKTVEKNLMLFTSLIPNNIEIISQDSQKLGIALTEVVYHQYRSRFRTDITAEQITAYEKNVLLGVIDYTWINHIDAMSKLRNGIYLRAYAQKDPLQEYTEEGFYMFEQMTQSIASEVSTRARRMGINNLSTEAEHAIGHRDIKIDFK